MLMIIPIEILMRMRSVSKVLQSQDLLNEAQASSSNSGGLAPGVDSRTSKSSTSINSNTSKGGRMI